VSLDRLGKKDKRVLEVFAESRGTRTDPVEGLKLYTDGVRLDGLWMGGSGIATWVSSPDHRPIVYFGPNASRSIQFVQHAVRRAVPAMSVEGYYERGRK
jgi:hypothetical protein